MTYAEHDGIGHLVADGKSLCGAGTAETIELDFEPRPLCWRCREKNERVTDAARST